MNRILVILVSLLICAVLQAQRSDITVRSEELASGSYSRDCIDILYTAPSSVQVSAYVNGVKQTDIAGKGGRPGSRRIRIAGLPEVEYEKCTIRLEFTDRDGRVIDVKEFVLAYKDPRSNLFMMSIGVGGTPSDPSFLPLTFPKYDATNIRDCFREYTKGYYIEKDFRLLCDPGETTSSAIRAKLNQMADDIRQGEVFMLYLSGHGEESDGEFYFVTSDARKNDLPHTALSGTDLRKYLHRMAAKQVKVYVFVDACHAEALYLKDENPSDGIVYYASCQADEMSAESHLWRNSVYANALIAAMKGTDGSAQVGGGAITVASLQDYLYSKVRRETGFAQNPVCYHPGYDDSHVVFKASVPQASETPVVPSQARKPDPPVPSEAADLFREARKYQTGDGVEKDLVHAFQLMKSAAEKGYVEAFRHLADMYHGGRGVAKDRDKAEYWYQKAADAGDKKAKEILYNM